MNARKLNLDLSEKLLKASEVAEFLNISRAFAYQLMKRGELRTVIIGAARRVRPQDLRRYLEAHIQITSN